MPDRVRRVAPVGEGPALHEGIPAVDRRSNGFGEALSVLREEVESRSVRPANAEAAIQDHTEDADLDADSVLPEGLDGRPADEQRGSERRRD